MVRKLNKNVTGNVSYADRVGKVEFTDISENEHESLPERLTAKKEENFSEWYNQVIQLAELIDKRYAVKGCFVWLPYGYQIMQNIKKFWDTLFQSHGIQEMYFPLLVPIEYAKKNEKWFKSFQSEGFWVSSLDDPKPKYLLRPTGEPAIYPMMKLWIRTKNDLPLRLYETVSSFRYETKHTRPLIRDREITVWHEIHTAHATKEESLQEAELHKKLYEDLWHYLAIEPIVARKPEWETFPGAVGAYEYYSVMPNGRVMENGSINILGQAYAKAFDIKYKDDLGREHYVWQVCTGNGARLLVAVIATHGDNHGLVLPPTIAPIQVVIVPIYSANNRARILSYSKKVEETLRNLGIRVLLDNREKYTPGWKFYEWEMKGVPLRIDIGAREVEQNTITLAVRHSLRKETVSLNNFEPNVLLERIHKEMLEKAKKLVWDSLKPASNLDEIKNNLHNKKVSEVYWCGEDTCWEKITGIEEGVEMFGFKLESQPGKCCVCGKKTNKIAFVAKTY